MRMEDLLDWLAVRPLQAFRIHLTNGVVYEIRHPDQIRVGRHTATIALPHSAGGTASPAQRDVTVAILHITHLEPALST